MAADELEDPADAPDDPTTDEPDDAEEVDVDPAAADDCACCCGF